MVCIFTYIEIRRLLLINRTLMFGCFEGYVLLLRHCNEESNHLSFFRRLTTFINPSSHRGLPLVVNTTPDQFIMINVLCQKSDNWIANRTDFSVRVSVKTEIGHYRHMLIVKLQGKIPTSYVFPVLLSMEVFSNILYSMTYFHDCPSGEFSSRISKYMASRRN